MSAEHADQSGRVSSPDKWHHWTPHRIPEGYEPPYSPTPSDASTPDAEGPVVTVHEEAAAALLDPYLETEPPDGWHLIDNAQADDLRHALEVGVQRLRAVVALHSPHYKIAGQWVVHRVPVPPEDAPEGHVCVIGEWERCSTDEHWIEACRECRWTTEDGDPAYPLWPCPTARLALAAGGAP